MNNEIMTPITADKIQKWIDQTDVLAGCQDEMLRLVVQLCDTNSGSYHLAGIEKVAAILVREFSCLGGQLNRMPVQPQKSIDDKGEQCEIELGPLLHFSKRPDVRPRILLCIHMDTVYSQTSTFQQCKTLSNGNVNGPGVADAKGGLVVMLYALKALEQSKLANQVGWEVIINPDEELGSPGSADFLRRRASQADFGLLFEPSLPDGSLVSARKGVGNYSFVVRGKSVHSGRDFAAGRNAVVACCRLMDAIHQLNTSDEVTLNVGKINGGAALNVVPNLSVGRVNVRVKTVDQMRATEQALRNLVDDHNHQDGISIEMFGSFSSPPKEITDGFKQLQNRVEVCANCLGRTINWRETGGASDGNKFAAAGLPNVDTLGPVGGNIHSDNEYLVPGSLVSAAQLTALTLFSFAGESISD